MRTGQTQSSPTAHPDCRVYIDSVLTGDCYASVVIGAEPARLVSVEAIEAVRGGRYTIEIDNSDSALSNKDYEGRKLYIGFGFVGTDKSFLHELRVHKQSFISKEGKLLLKLIAIDNLGLLSFYKGTLGGNLWNHPGQSMDILDVTPLPTSGDELPDDLKAAINSQYEQTPFDIITTVVGQTIGADVVLVDDDGYVNSVYPLVSAPDARSTVLQALEVTKCYLLCSTDEFKIIQPDAHSTVYSYNAANLFFNNVIEEEAVIPNRVIFHGIDEDGKLISTGATHGKNQASIDRLGEIAEHQTYTMFDIESYETQEDVDSLADARIAKIALGKATGLIVAPMHCSQELYDKIQIVDNRYPVPKTVTGYIFEIQRVYDRGKYSIALYLGGVGNDYTPEGGAPLNITGLWTPSPPNMSGIEWDKILPQAIQGYHHDITFSSVSQTQVNWTAGTIKFYDGTTQAISSGSINLADSAIRYIYFDLDDASPNVLKSTTSYVTVMTMKTGMICLVQKGSATGIKATFIPSYGKEPLLTPDFIDMTGLKSYTYGDGTQIQGIFSTQVQAGHIYLSAQTAYASGYDPTGKEIQVHRGTSAPADTTKLWFDTNYYIMKRYTGSAWVALSGEWYLKSGVLIDATKGIRLYGTDMAFATFGSEADARAGTNWQTKMDSSGCIWAGSNKVKLSADGIDIYGQFFRLRDSSGNLKGDVWWSTADSAITIKGQAAGAGIRLDPSSAHVIFVLGSGYYAQVGGSGIIPTVNNSGYCGISTQYWYASYANYVMYKTHTSFDHKDDFALIKNIKPDKKDPTKVDKSTLPKEVIEEMPDGDHFIRMGDMMGLLQGTLKKLILRVEAIEAALDKGGK